MDRATFTEALELLKRSGIGQARLLGGEPTLHPDFVDLLDEVFAKGFSLLVFSNGLMPESAIQRLADAPDGQSRMLINLSQVEQLNSGEKKQLFSLLSRLGPRIIPGINIDRPGVQLDFLLDLIREFHLLPSVRLGLAHPRAAGDNHFLHPRYYQGIGERILDFSLHAQKNGVAIQLDCGFVPCMFPEKGLECLGISDEDIGRRCNPIPDLLPDGTLVSCYPLSGLFRIPLSDVRDTRELQGQFEKKWAPYRKMGIFRQCSICHRRKDLTCTGGCLALAIGRLRHGNLPFHLPPEKPTHTSSMDHKTENSPPSDIRIESRKRQTSRPDRPIWAIPYVDQPVRFWEQIAKDYGSNIKEVYFPLPDNMTPTGRPEQPSLHLSGFLTKAPLPKAVLINPVVFPRPVEAMAPAIIQALKRLMDTCQLTNVTVSSLMLAQRIREVIPSLSLTASVLMDIADPVQIQMLGHTLDTLVPASRIMRNLPRLERLRAAFHGRIRLIVNEGCLPGCVFRVQHFFEMMGSDPFPQSLCEELLREHPWMRLTGAWVLPQHLHFFYRLYDELKLAGRITLQNPKTYLEVLEAYIKGRHMTPDRIGGGPASPLERIHISAAYYKQTLNCGHICHECNFCREYFKRRSSCKTDASHG